MSTANAVCLFPTVLTYADAMPVPAVELEVGNRTVRVTSPDKIYFPDVGLTKLDIVSYVVDRRRRHVSCPQGSSGHHGALAWRDTGPT